MRRRGTRTTVGIGRAIGPDRVQALCRGAARGAIAAMAMSGLRRVTTALDLVAETPPESILRRTAPRLLTRVPVRRRPALVEFAHWSYGAFGGALFGALPPPAAPPPVGGAGVRAAVLGRLRGGHRAALGLTERTHGAAERAALLADHLLYGAVVAAAPGLYQD